MTEQEERTWTIKRTRSAPPDSLPGTRLGIEQAVAGPDTDWIEVVPASRVQELEGERESTERHFTIALRSAQKAQDKAESHLARLEEALKLIAAKGDYVTEMGDGKTSIVCVHPRELEEVAAIARAALTHSTPPRSDG